MFCTKKREEKHKRENNKQMRGHDLEVPPSSLDKRDPL
jgi:hypothetical protein